MRPSGAARRRTLRLAPAALLLLLPAIPAPGEGAVLVRYSFDDEATETGPDTFRVFANSKGTVRLSHAFRWSGESSVEIRDVADDGDFPELQGRFPAIEKGTVFAHFALLTTTPEEEFNVALAGPRGFRLERNGIAFWLKGQARSLFHVSDSIPKRLLPLEPFTWYFIDVAYRVEAGTYDVVIREEGRTEPRVRLTGQPNAASQPGSLVDTFSFVGDVEDDASRVVYYVDDVAIGTDQDIPQIPFAAPGRRRLFVDSLVRQRGLLDRPSCLPASEPADLGLGPKDVAELKGANAFGFVEKLVAGQRMPRGAPIGALSERSRDALQAAVDWSEGCRAFAAGDAAAALSLFEAAAERFPGRIYRLSAALALARLGRPGDADEALAAVSAEWAGDPRYPVALAIAGATRGDLLQAEEALRPAAERALVGPLPPGSGDPDARCRALGDRLAAEEYFSVLLSSGFGNLAAAFADRMIERLAASRSEAGEWTERRGDAAFVAGDWDTARALYERCAGASPTALLKLADVAFRLGDLATEKALRERIYGSLRFP